MTRVFIIVSLVSFTVCAGIVSTRAFGGEPPADLDGCNVVWTTPSHRASGSMPLGNGEVGVNVWVEEDGDLRFYVSRTDALAESARLLKVGRVRVALDPNPFRNGLPFRQELRLREGLCRIEAGAEHDQVTLELFVDVNSPVIYLQGTSASPLTMTVTTESWRERKLDVRKSIDWHSAFTMRRAPFPVIESADVFPEGLNDAIAWYHRNRDSLAFDTSLELQSLTEFRNLVHDPLDNRTFGGWISGSRMTAVDNRTLRTLAPTKQISLRVATPCEQTETAQAWLTLARDLARDADPSDAARSRTAQWWSCFWSRSWIFIDDHDPGSRVDNTTIYSRAYTLQRYMNACGGRGKLPIKFNGSIFTVEPPDRMPHDPDFRLWGDAHWWQNIRFPYHAMLACGDFKMMQPMFRMYEDARPLAEARTRKYLGAEGTYYPETMTPWGTYGNGDYGWNRPAGRPLDDIDIATDHTWNETMELVALMLDYCDYTGDKAFLVNRVLPMAASSLRYFDSRFRRDEKGALVIQPTQAVETYQYQVTNDAPTVAGLIDVTSRLCALPKQLVPVDQQEFFRAMHASCPPVPTEMNDADGAPVRELAPAEAYNPGRSNCENPEMYAVWPYRLYGVGRPGIDVALAAYAHRVNVNLHGGWGYDGSCAALLGLTDEAQRMLKDQCRNSNGNYRWPATWGPNFDWMPDQCHGGNLMLTAQYMLLQPVGDKLYLLPTWPKDWDVNFKLHAPQETVVECTYRDGNIQRLMVTPSRRRDDVVLPYTMTQERMRREP